MRNPHLYLASAVVAAGLFIGGCSKSDQPAAPSTATPSAAPAVPAAPDTSQATATLAKVKTDIANKDWASADTDLKSLESQKAQLPADIQSQLASLRTAVDAGKSMPAVPTLPH